MHTLLPGTHKLFLARGILHHNCATRCVDITNKVYLRWSGIYAGPDLDTQSWSGLLTASMQARQTRGSHSEKRQTNVHNQRIEHQPIPLMHLLPKSACQDHGIGLLMVAMPAMPARQIHYNCTLVVKEGSACT